MRIYLDNGATTKMSQAAIHAMLPYMDTIYGNPSSLHSAGQAAAMEVEITFFGNIIIEYADHILEVNDS